MTNSTQAATTVSNIGVVMFTVADQDAALAFYTDSLGSRYAATAASARTASTAGWRSRRPDRPLGWHWTRR